MVLQKPDPSVFLYPFVSNGLILMAM